MRFTTIALVLCTCVWLSAGDVAHLKAAKAKLLGRLASKHHKRGVLSSVPPFKLGHDFPRVTHSVVKPLVVNYPPTAAVTAVKVPLSHPLLHRYPVPVGHRVPVPHPHYGLDFPHHTKSVVLPKPDQHFHHHHHHAAPRPVIPTVSAHPAPAIPFVPVGQPTATFAHPIPAPPLIQPAPVVPAPQPLPVSPPFHILPPDHGHFKQVLPSPFPIQPAPVVSPVFPLAQQYPYILRPGNAVQSSLFATYPRYPFSYPTPLIPSASFGQVLYDRPQVPHYHLVPQGGAPDSVVIEQPGTVPIEPTPTLLHAHGEIPQPTVHLQPAQPGLHLEPVQPGVHLHPAHPDIHLHSVQPDIHLQHAQSDLHLHSAQSDIHHQPTHPGIHLHTGQPDIHLHAGQPDVHLQSAQPGINLQPGYPDIHLQPGHPGIQLQPTQPAVIDHNGWSPVPSQSNDLDHLGAHYPQVNDGHHQITQEQATQVFEHHAGQDQYHDYQHQLQHHIQQQIEQAQYDQHINNQHKLSQEYGVPQQLGQEYGQPNQDYSQHAQEYAQHGQEYSQQSHEYPQHGQEYPQHGQEYLQHGQELPQHGQDYFQHGQEYPQHDQESPQHAQDYPQNAHEYPQHGQEYAQNDYNLQQQQPGQEYGLPQQGAEGRSAEGEGEGDNQLYHNHIPLGLQPPINRPLEHFR